MSKEFSEENMKPLPWRTRAELHPDFAEAAFALPVGGVTAQPIKTDFGYHIILVEGKE